jgi:hypothetical protein
MKWDIYIYIVYIYICECLCMYICTLLGHAEIGNWKGAWKGVNAVNESVFSEAGGNGQSRSNSLWYVDDDDVYLNKLQTKGVKKSILYM